MVQQRYGCGDDNVSLSAEEKEEYIFRVTYRFAFARAMLIVALCAANIALKSLISP